LKIRRECCAITLQELNQVTSDWVAVVCDGCLTWWIPVDENVCSVIWSHRNRRSTRYYCCKNIKLCRVLTKTNDVSCLNHKFVVCARSDWCCGTRCVRLSCHSARQHNKASNTLIEVDVVSNNWTATVAYSILPSKAESSQSSEQVISC
jgi:hypothetical protein